MIQNGRWRRRMSMVLATMYKHGEMTQDEISNATGIDKEYVNSLLTRLCRRLNNVSRKFKVRSLKKKYQQQIYSLKPACREWIRKGNLKAWGERYG